MEDLIREIIDNAKEMKSNPEITDYDIAKFVHIELGKIMYYDNNYSAKIENEGSETNMSQARKSNMLKAKTSKVSKAQICKGMAEAYAEILNEVGIEARAIGVEKKGELQEVGEDKAKHYCTIFKIDGKEYVQDYLIESALTRIKVGEAEMTPGSMPGICPIEEYQERAQKSLSQNNLSPEYINSLFGEEIADLSEEEKFNLVFEKLNECFQRDEASFGFEEAKDFVFLVGKNFIKSRPKIANILKETEDSCDIACIYEINGKKFLVRGEDESTGIRVKAGEISDEEFAEILEQGYEGRGLEDRTYISQSKALSIINLTENAIKSGVTAEEVREADGAEKEVFVEREEIDNK